MSRSTAETLKQIQKQGLSISIVSRDSPRASHVSDSSVSKEVKPKQIVSIDKTPKLPTRSSAPTESKATLSQARLPPNTGSETRASGGQPPSQSLFQEAKSSINKTMPSISVAGETRAFGSLSWSNPPHSESKVQAGSNRAVQSAGTYAESKNPSGSVRLSQGQATFNENKSQNTKGSQGVAEHKVQGRISQVSSDSKQSNSARNHLTFEGKFPSSHGRSPLNSPPLEGKVMNASQSRQSQNFPHDHMSGSTQRTIPQMLNDSKAAMEKSKSIPTSRPMEVKFPTQLQSSQIMKRQGKKVIILEQQTIPQSNLAVNSPFLATSANEKSISMEEKPFFKVAQVSQNTVKSKNQSSMHMTNFQSTSMQSESKAVSQVVKISTGQSNKLQKIPISFESLSDAASPGLNTMSSMKIPPKRPQTVRTASGMPLKRKCLKRNSSNVDLEEDKSAANSIEAGTPKEIEKQGFTRGLTITPVNATRTTASSLTTRKIIDNNKITVVLCPNCSQHSQNTSFCENCNTRIPANAQKYQMTKVKQDQMTGVVIEQKILTTSRIEKKIVYQFPTDMSPNQNFNFQQTVQGKNVFDSSPVSRGRGRPKTRRKAEPVCYTLSSDDDDAPCNPMAGAYLSTQIHPLESDCSKSEHSSGSEIYQDDNGESDDPQYPGVMDINPNLDGEEEPEEEMEYEGEEVEEEEEEHFIEEEQDDEELEEEEDEEEIHREDNAGQDPTEYPVRCRSIRIGSYKVHPPALTNFLAVLLQPDGIVFKAPKLSDNTKHAIISLQKEDIHLLKFHFGRCLPIMFIYTTQKFGETVRKALDMIPNQIPYFDPGSNDEKTQKLTFLIEQMTEEQKNFIRMLFLGDNKVHEIDQKTANEILVRSTPQTVSVVKVKGPDPITVQPLQVSKQPNTSLEKLKGCERITVTTIENHLPQGSSQLSVTKVVVPPQPVVNLITYPPPPQTGGITITNEDLACLNEGEFLNDAIIDFYLKYLFYEKLTPVLQDRTYIFSSYFYPRLTQKPDRTRSGEEPNKAVSVRRHNQVKTWTRHVDIFSKDFIIIPVNQNVHWFLAIICYPNRVPDAPNVPENKAADSVTSTDEQEHTSKVIIKEIGSNGDENSLNLDDNSMESNINSPYEVEEPPDSDECSESPDSSTHPDGRPKKEMPCICIFDSLTGPNRWRIPLILREYLEMEWKSKKGTKKVFDKNTMHGFVMKCPQQTNYSDCGTYLLQFVESFFENPFPLHSIPMPDLTNWFTEEKINKKRQQLKDLILSLQKKQQVAARKMTQHQRQMSTNMQQKDNR